MDTYEKKYKEALEKLRDFYRDYDTVSCLIDVKEELANLFPELKESEDELTWLTKYIEEEAYWLSLDIRDDEDRIKLKKLQESLAWLEKQGEKKSLTIDIKSMVDSYEQRLIKNGGVNNSPLVNMCVAAFQHGVENTLDELHLKQILANSAKTCKDEPKFKVGDWVVLSTSDREKVVQIDSIEYFKSGEPRYITSEGRWFGNGTKAYLWTLQNAKDGDVLAGKIDGDNYILIFKQIKDGWVETYGHYYDSVDRFCVPSQLFCRDYQGTFILATKEQRDLLFSKMQEAGYEWNAEKKELKKISQRMISAEAKEAMYDKPAWSEEDEKHVFRIKLSLQKDIMAHKNSGVDITDLQDCENWLESLKERIKDC